MPEADLCHGSVTAAWATSLRPTDRQLLNRFRAQRDEEAFAELVRRHGPMVLGVCRRVLGDGHAAEDAFQATFLLLVRKSKSLRDPELLANWLYGVAYRTALKTRSRASRQRTIEQRAVEMTVSDPSLDVTMRELQSVLDEELDSLPEKYRAPLVLCYLEGKTNIQAARALGWPEGSISRRLARGLELLRARLTRRGLTLSALLLALLLSQESAGAALPASLIASTARTAALVAAGQTPAEASAVTEIVEDVLQSSRPELYRLGGATLALLLLLGGIWTWTQTHASAASADRPPGGAASSSALEPASCGGTASVPARLPGAEAAETSSCAASACSATSACSASTCSAGR
jgi:RNA polymerase sigma factor (sigma-70 family)